MRIDSADLRVADPTSRGRIVSAYCKAFARAAVVCVILMSAINAALMDTGYGNAAEFATGTIIGIFAVALFTAVVMAGVLLLRYPPASAVAAVGGALLALAYLRNHSPASLLRTLFDPAGWKLPSALPDSLSVPALTLVVVAIASISGLLALFRSGQLAHLGKPARTWLPLLTVLLAVGGAAVSYDLLRDGHDPFPASHRLSGERQAIATLPDPSRPGAWQTEFLSYGAGENRRRPEFGTARDLSSRSVDAAALLPDWKDLKQRMRERYWGFGLSNAPLNGLLWAPVGDGPYPLVLIVHGNHGMEDYSDTGYAYLGELLASRGFLVVSVDENFINGSWSGDFQGKEMPLRAWFLLEHLKLWRDWNADENHRFYGKVDLDRIALMGHSRGGEAVSIAHAYNKLSRYPDDATVEFDYGFNIRSLVAIAQVDQRYHRRVELQDVNFFTIHGSYDSDEPAYHGMRQFNRIELAPDQPADNYRVKAGVYLHGANHGQFNTGWGRSDYSPPASWLLNLAPIIPAEDQRQAARVFIAAFLEATLRDDPRYLELLRDPRSGVQWLPDLPFVQQFTDSTFVPLANFEEDLEVSTATIPAARISAEAVGLWREEDLEHRDQRKQGTNVVVLGWNSDSNGQASYSIALNGGAGNFTMDRALTFAVSGSTEDPPDTDPPEDADDDAAGDKDKLSNPAFRIELIDASGEVASAVSSNYVTLAPPMKVRYMKNAALNDERYNSAWEPVLQHFELPLKTLAASNPAFDLDSIRQLVLRFDRQPEGVIILDDIGTIDIPRATR